MNRQPTEIKSKIKKNTELIVLLEVITIKDENIAIIEKKKKKSNELSFIYMVYLALYFLLKLSPICLRSLTVFLYYNKVLLLFHVANSKFGPCTIASTGQDLDINRNKYISAYQYHI